jgi:iron complex outermembrane recepter protein
MHATTKLSYAIACVLTGASLGQPVTSVAADEPAIVELEEVVVTARKREERLMDVPIAVSAIDSDTLVREQINVVREIAAFTPGLIINSDGGGRAFVSIRGIGTTLIDTVQPGVGIFVDGIYQANTSYLNNPMLDVERVEVLRGPQGTLFGNNTLGGAINVITRAPTDDFTGRFSADRGYGDGYETYSGSLSGPIIEGSLRGRIAGSYHEHDGFSKNLLAGGNARPVRSTAINGTLAWSPVESADITLNAYSSSLRSALTAYGNPAGPKDYEQDVMLNTNSIVRYDYYGANLKGVFDLAGMNSTLTLVAAYDDKKGDGKGDADFGPVDFARMSKGVNTLETTTGEVRIDTEWNDRISTLVGVFASSSDMTNRTLTDLPLFGITGIPAALASDSDAVAVFANVFWDITSSLELSAGLRYDDQSVDSIDEISGFKARYTAEEWEPRVALTRHWTDDVMTYASIARGFRGGGTNVPGAPNPVYEGDSVWTYEIGSKMALLDRALNLNLAVYYNDYQDYIGQNSLYPVGNTFIAINLNTGDVESYGVEAEGLWQATERFSLSGNVSLNHTRITDASQLEDTTGRTLPSDRILFVPDWTYSTTASYVLPVGEAGNLRFDATVLGKGDRLGSSLSETFAPELEAYHQLNANITWSNGPWAFSLWATNLTNEIFFESYLDSSLLSEAGFVGPLVNNLGITSDERRVGVRVSAKF